MPLGERLGGDAVLPVVADAAEAARLVAGQLAEQARQEAYEILIAHAQEIGANAVLAMRYDANEIAAAVTRGGAALYPTATATTVRVSGGRGGNVLTTDGPYADTKEALTGFFILECADLDEADQDRVIAGLREALGQPAAQ